MNRKNRSFNREPEIRPSRQSESGFTLIELMIVVAVIAIILTIAIPTYSNYSIRAKIAEGLSLAKAAKTAVATTCTENRTLASLNKAAAGYEFDGATTYVDDIDLSGSCTAPVITVRTLNTGASPDPVLTITGNFVTGGHISWTCTSDGSNIHVPDTCRS